MPKGGVKHGMADETENRLIDLETIATHQAKVIEELSALVADQWQTIDKMQKKLEALITRFHSFEDQAAPPPENTKPPHW